MSNTQINNKYLVYLNTDSVDKKIIAKLNVSILEYNFYYNNDMSNFAIGCSNLNFNLDNDNVKYDYVTNMSNAFNGCQRITGSPIIPINAYNLSNAYRDCYNLMGYPICSNRVIDFNYTYCNCNNLIGSPVCSNSVTSMAYTYSGCSNLTGNPVCGYNVWNMSGAYCNCNWITGNVVCGNSVEDMSYTYYGCYEISGNPIVGNNVLNMSYSYYNCRNIYGNLLLKNSDGMNFNSINMENCFYGRNNQNILNIYCYKNSKYDKTLYYETNSNGMIYGVQLNWENMNNGYYNEMYNTYVYNNL